MGNSQSTQDANPIKNSPTSQNDNFFQTFISVIRNLLQSNNAAPEKTKSPTSATVSSPRISDIPQYRYQSRVVHDSFRKVATNQSFSEITKKGLQPNHSKVIYTESRNIQRPEISKQNLQLFKIINTITTDSEIIKFITLTREDKEYSRVTRMISRKNIFKIDKIEKIDNPFLEKAYELKKEQKKLEFPNLIEKLLFHGTKQKNVDNICKMNFNWRFCQAHKYGRGISFSPNSTYASVYSDNDDDKVMLVAKVMIGKTAIGNKSMTLPPKGYDTTEKDGGVVIVKFEDNEFYPVYKIYYHMLE